MFSMNDTTNNITVKSGKVLLFLLLFLTGSLSAQLPNGFIDAKLQSGYISPMGVIFSKNGQKMFVWEKAGKLWCSTWNGAMYVKQTTPTLDLSEEVGDWRDFGLQSVALDPNFDTNGLIYMFYQVDRHHLMNFGTPQYSPTKNEYFAASISRLTRYKVTTANGVATVDNATRKVLLGETKSTGVPLIYESHGGGQIIFGADGTLLVTTGDNASFVSHDLGNDVDTYWRQAVDDGILRPTENVGSLRAQQINSFCGKLLRLDPNSGDAVASNPYYDAANPRSAKSRVWALGFRNPYRMAFKTGTGETNPANGNPGTFIVGDVQDGTWEELHMIEKGGVNCGWPLYEGIEPYYVFYNSGKTDPEEVGNPTFVSNCARGGRGNINNPVPSQRRFSHAAPCLDYHHLQNTARTVDYTRGNTEAASALGSVGSIAAGTGFKGNCVTAGTYYTGTKFPPNYRNVFFFADYGNNWIKAASLHDNETHQLHEVLDFADTGYGKGIVDVEYCPLDESLVYININTGDVQKISFGEGNRPPKAVATADKTSGASPLTVNFSSTGTNHPDGKPLNYKWDFGDGTTSTSANPTHIFTSTGSRGFTVVLTVTDTSGLTDVANLSISTNNTAPSVKISNPADNSLYTLIGASLVTLESAITDNDTTGMQYAWQVTLRHNNHEHREPINRLKNPIAQISPVGCDGEEYYYFIELTVTDNGGLVATDSAKIYPDCNSGNISITNLKATAKVNAVDVTWSNPPFAFDEIMVVAKEGSGFLTNPSGTDFTADTNFRGAGSAYEGGKVVYRGTGTNVNVSNLTADRTYFFRVFTRKGTSWTGGVEASAVPTPPVPEPTNLTATPQVNAVDVTWTNPVLAFDEVMIVAQPSGSISILPTGTAFTANANFGGNGAAFQNGKVVYRGIGTRVTVTGLTAGTVYYFRIFTRQGTTWTTNLELSAVPTEPLAPSSPTNVVATAQINAVDLTWTNPTAAFDDIMVVAQATNSITTTPNGTTYTADASFTGEGTAYEDGKVVYRGTGTNVNVSNLTAGTTYFFNVYTRQGTLWSDGVEASAVPTAPQPPPSPTNLRATSQINAVALTWTNPTADFDDIMIVAQATNGITTAPSGTTYTANASFTGSGTAFQNGKVVYRGTGTNMTVTNLIAGTTYFFRVFTRKGDLWSSGVETSAIPSATPPPPSPTNLSATPQVNAVAVAWTNPTVAFDEVMVVAQANRSISIPPSGTSYTADARFTGAGTTFQTGKVVYRGTGTGMTVTSLTAGTTYFFRVFTRKGSLWSGGSEVSAVPTAPLPPPSPTNLSLIPQTNAVAVAWTNPTATFDEVMVVAQATNSITATPNGTTYTDDAVFTGGGTTFQNGKVVYRGTGTNVTVTSLTASTTYYFRVYTREGTLWSSGVEASAVPTAPSAAPSPTNLSATPQTRAVAVAWTNPTVTFDEVMVVAQATSSITTTPNGTTYTSDAVFTGGGTTFQNGKVVYRGTGTNVTVTSLTEGTTYFFRVFTRRGALWSSGVEVSAVPIAPRPSSPTNVSATAQTNAVDLTWINPTVAFDDIMIVAQANNGITTPPSVTTYTADASFTGAGTTFQNGKVVYLGRGTSMTVTDLTAGTLYYFRVYTRKGNLWSGGSQVTAVPTAPPAAPSPTNLSATPQTRAVAVAWTNPTVTFDEVLVVAQATNSITTTPNGMTYTSDAVFTGGGTTFQNGKVVYRGTGTNVTVTSLTEGMTYFFRVFTRRGALWSSGVEASAVPIAPRPSSPTNVRVTAQTNAVDLTWTNPTVAFDDIMIVAQANNGITTPPSVTTYTADASFTGAGTTFQNGKVVYLGRGTSMTVTDLTAGTLYYFRVYTRKGNLWSGGSQVTAVPTAPPAAPSPTNLSATPQTRAVAVAWTNPTVTFDEVLVVAQATNSITTTPNGTTYTSDAVFTGGGTTFQNGKVVYRGIGTNVTVTSLTEGMTYFFRVFTRRGVLWSSGVEASAVPIAPRPSSPTNVSATAQTNAVDLTWINPTVAFDDIMIVAQANNGITTPPSVTTYTADASFTGAGTTFQNGKVVYLGRGTSMTVTNLTAGTLYYFRVYTRKGSLWSGGSQVTAVPIAPVVPTPTNLNLTPQTSSVVVTWTNPTAAFDEVMVTTKANTGFATLPTGSSQSANSIFTGTATIFEGGKVTYRGTGTSVTVTGLTAPTNYFFRVYVRRGTVWYSGVQSSAIPIAPIPPTPTNLTATAQTNAVAVAWTSPTLSYDEVMVVAKAGSGFTSLPSGISYTADASFTGLGSSFESGKVTYRGTGSNVTVSNLTTGTTYYFRVYVRKGSVWYNGTEASAVPTEPATPLGCLKGSYFNNTSLSGNPLSIRAESSINYSWGTGSPFSGVNSDNFSVRWDGTVFAPVAGTYTFAVTADDGVRLWVNNILIIDKWSDQSSSQTYTATVTLTQGQNVPIKMEYYEKLSSSTAKLFWTVPNKSSVSVPFSACALPQFGCLKGSYFNNTTLTGTPLSIRAESSINYNWSGSPLSGVNSDNFSVRWEGSVLPPNTGAYKFSVTTDDGVRLWVNNVLIVDKWFDQGPTTYTATVNLTQGQTVPIKMEYYERTGSASVKLCWTIPNQTNQVIDFLPCSISPFDATKCYKLTEQNNNRVLIVPNSSTTNGTQLQTTGSYSGTKTELWRIKDLGDGSQRLVNTNSGKSMTVLNSSILNSAAIVQWDWQSGTNQRWIFNKNSSGFYQIIAKNSGKAMEATSSNNNSVVQNSVGTSKPQQFKVETATCPSGAVAMESANILTANGYRDGKKAVITWVSNANDNTDYFAVQKLNNDQQIFEKLASLNAQQGNTGETKFYSVDDIEPTDGDNLYRVVLYRNGQDIPQYSEIIALDFSFLNDYMLFPNPANDYVDIDLDRVRYKYVEIDLMDASGKLVRQQKIESAPVAPFRLSLEGLPVGQYFIRIEAEGKREVVKQLMIVR